MSVGGNHDLASGNRRLDLRYLDTRDRPQPIFTPRKTLDRMEGLRIWMWLLQLFIYLFIRSTTHRDLPTLIGMQPRFMFNRACHDRRMA